MHGFGHGALTDAARHEDALEVCRAVATHALALECAVGVYMQLIKSESGV